MPVSDEKYEALAKRLEALEASGGKAEGLDPGKPHPQHTVRIKHRCGHEENHPSPMVPDSPAEKKAIASLRGKYCNACQTRKRQREVIAADRRRKEGLVDETALTTAG